MIVINITKRLKLEFHRDRFVFPFAIEWYGVGHNNRTWTVWICSLWFTLLILVDDDSLFIPEDEETKVVVYKEEFGWRINNWIEKHLERIENSFLGKFIKIYM